MYLYVYIVDYFSYQADTTASMSKMLKFDCISLNSNYIILFNPLDIFLWSLN